MVGPSGGAQIQKSENHVRPVKGRFISQSPRERCGAFARAGVSGEALLLTFDRVENSGLAERLLVLGRRVTTVVAVLGAANASVGVGFIWLLGEIR